MKKKMFKRGAAAISCFVLIIAGCIIAESSGFLASNIPEHNGEVLVDSLNISEEPVENNNKDGSETEAVTSDDTTELEQGDTYFKEMRATINLDRNEMISMLTDAEATATTSSEKENANEQKTALMENMQQEQEIENAIIAKGLPESLVLITENGINVTVNKQELSETDVAKICDIVMRETGREASQIIIQSKF